MVALRVLAVVALGLLRVEAGRRVVPGAVHPVPVPAVAPAVIVR
ncbi:hypothetical protein SAMN04244548_02678 [Paracoccus pantotrophus]|nr:hypothetical protein SAMN04244548_02678 [Paracoccus pantotrophus]